jgi:hypothetical protein
MEYGAVDREECVYMAKLAEQVCFEHNQPMGGFYVDCVSWEFLRKRERETDR